MVDRMDQIPVMGDEDQSFSSFTTHAREKLGDLVCVLIVEVADWLVGENERRIGHTSSSASGAAEGCVPTERDWVWQSLWKSSGPMEPA